MIFTTIRHPLVRSLHAVVGACLLLSSHACKTTSDEEAAALTAASPAPVKVKPVIPPAPEPPAPTAAVNGFRIAELEYWPFRWREADKTCVYPYPTAVRYGFASGSAAAQRCMREAYRTLWAALHDPPAALTRWRDQGGPETFYLWINDYTEAKSEASGEPVADCQPDATMRSIWHFDPPYGAIKYVGEVYKDGSCHLSTVEDLVRFSEAARQR